MKHNLVSAHRGSILDYVAKNATLKSSNVFIGVSSVFDLVRATEILDSSAVWHVKPRVLSWVTVYLNRFRVSQICTFSNHSWRQSANSS